jgi:hypothetical protein
MREIQEAYSVADYRRFIEWMKGDPTTRKKFTHRKNSASVKATEAFRENDRLSFCTYDELLGLVSFLKSMNRRQYLFYRGQTKRYEAITPALFRAEWNSPIGRIDLTDKRKEIFQRLCELHVNVAKQVSTLGVPREATLFDIRESTWAILQHYGLWPTPLIDITSSLGVALSFALNFGKKKEGYLYIIGMPALHGSVTHHVDEHVVIAQLQSICPPCAMRPHRQDSLLVGRHPFYGIGQGDGNDEVDRNNLSRRTIATIHIDNSADGFRSIVSLAGQRKFLLAEDKLQDMLMNYFEKSKIWKSLN